MARELPAGYSRHAGKRWLALRLAEVNPASALDVGAGAGTYGRMARALLPGAYLTAVEVWQPWVARFRLGQVYDTVCAADARATDLGEHDVVILGDVLDRMPAADAAALWSAARSAARLAVLASLVVANHDQHTTAEAGNPYDRRAAEWSHGQALAVFTGIAAAWVAGDTGVYLAGGHGRAGRTLAIATAGTSR